MASLKDINATIEEGNEDLEKLNRNFTKWFESQRKGGDDLEAAAEARTKKAKSGGAGGGGIVKAAATGAAVSKMSEKDGISKYLKYALPLMLPMAWPFIRDFMNKKRDIDGDGVGDISLTEGAVATAALYGAKKFSNVGTRIGERLARAREVKLNLANQKAFQNRLKALEIQIKVDEASRKLEQKRLSDILKAQKALTQIPKGTTTGLNIPANFNRPPVSTQTMSQSLANANKPATSNIKPPTAANTNTPVTNTKARSSSAFKKFLNRTSSLNKLGGFNSIKQGMSSVTNAGSKLIKGVMPTIQNFGKNTKAYLKALTAWAQTMNPGATAKKVGMLLLRVIAKLVFPVALAASTAAWAQVMFGQKDGVTGKLISYSPNEKIAATGEFIGGWTGFGIGAAIGAAIGANALGIGALPGAVIGGIFGALSGAELAEILFLWAARKNRELQATINAQKAALMGAGLFQTDPAFARIGGLNAQGQNMFQAFGANKPGNMNANILQRDDFDGPAFIPTTAGTKINNMQTNADMIPGYKAMAASRSKARQFVSNGLDYRDVFLGGADILTNQRTTDASRPPDFIRGISGGG
ncbi:MAG: hypothetical protein ACR2OP_08780, partial [Amylibacter sp.]